MPDKTQQTIDFEEQVYTISSLVAGDFELQEVLDKLAEAAAKITKANSCSIRLLDDEADDLKMRSTYNLSEEYRNKGPVTKNDIVIKEAFEGKAVVIDDMRDDDRIKYKQASAKENLVSQLTVSMTFKNKPIGILRLYSPNRCAFDNNDIVLARLIASQCAAAITNARLYAQALEGARMTEQMRLAAVIQRRMIPEHPPCIKGLDVAAVYQPCFQIGGDLYDFIEVNDHTLVVAIADVIGKGIPAAIMMSMFRGTIRAYSDGGYERHSMEEIIHELNNVALRECRNGEFITLFIATINVETMTMTYCNCGHEPGLLMRNNTMKDLSTGGLVLGIKDDGDYATETVSLQNNDILLLYTDGLIDAVNFEGDLWGRERMIEVLMNCEECCSDMILRTILGFRRRFVGLASQIDDTSIVAIKVDDNSDIPCDCKEPVKHHD